MSTEKRRNQMAYISQERKAQIAAVVKPILAKYGMRGTLSVHHHSTLNLTLTSGPVDFVADHVARSSDLSEPLTYERGFQLSHHWFHERFTGQSLAFLTEIFAALNTGNHDRSDSQTDYFDVGWYAYVNVGKWNKPYTCTAKNEAIAA